jgi:hypothetical protein
MHQASRGHVAGDEGVFDRYDLPLAERIVAGFLSLAVRLWCLPALLLVWVLTWTAILLVRLVCLVKGVDGARGGKLLAGSGSPAVWQFSSTISTRQDKAVL